MTRSNYSTETLERETPEHDPPERPVGYTLHRRVTDRASSFFGSPRRGTDKLIQLFANPYQKEVRLRRRGSRPSSPPKRTRSNVRPDRDVTLMSGNVVPKIVIRDSVPKVLSRQQNLTLSNPQPKTISVQKPAIPDCKTVKSHPLLPTSYSSADSDGERQQSSGIRSSRVPNEEEHLQTLAHDADLSRPRLHRFDFAPTPSTKYAHVPLRIISQSKGSRSLALHPGDTDFEDSLVRVLDAYETSRCTLRLEPAVIAFIALQLVIEVSESVRAYVVLVGGAHRVCATTYQSYVRATWPDLAEQILDIFDILVSSISRSEPVTDYRLELFSSSQKSVNEILLSLHLPKSSGSHSSCSSPASVEIRLSSKRSTVARIVDALAFFCTTAQPTRCGLGYSGCSLYQKYSQDGEVVFDLEGDYQASLLKYSSDWPSNCWMPLVPNFAIAGNNASPPRPHQINGMEVTFDLMCYLCGLEYEIIEGDGLVLYGPNSMVYPVRQIGKCIEWHFEKSDDGQSPPASGNGQRLSVTDLSALCDNTRHFIGLWTDPLITLGTEQCDHRQIKNSSLAIIDRETNRDGRSVGVSIALPKVLSLNWSENYRVTSTRRSPFTAVPFLHRLDLIKDVPVLLYSVSDRRAWLVSFVSVLLHLGRARAHQLGYSIPPCEPSSDGGEAALRKIRECYTRPMDITLPQDDLDEEEKAYTIKVFLRDTSAALESIRREGNRKRGIFRDQIVGYEMADIAHSREELHMKTCNLESSGWAPLLDEVSTVLFCQNLPDPIVDGSRALSQTTCMAANWDHIPRGFNILTASLPCLRHLCFPFNAEGGMTNLTRTHKWHVPGSSMTRAPGHVFSGCSCDRGEGCHKLQEMKKDTLFRGSLTPPSRRDLSNNKFGAVLFRHNDEMISIVSRLQTRRPQRVSHRLENNRLSVKRHEKDKDDSGYSSASSSTRRIPATRSRRPADEKDGVAQGKPRPNNGVMVSNRVIAIKIRAKDIEIRTLEHFKLPWKRETDNLNRKWIIIKRYIDEELQKDLFKHTRELREEDEIELRLKKRPLKRSNTLKLLKFWNSLENQVSELLDQSAGESPSWNVVHTEFDNGRASWAIRCQGKVLIVDIATDDLEDWSGRTEFENLLRDAPDDYDAEDSLIDLIYETCSSLILTYAPDSADTHPFTLQDYYTAGVNVFQLISAGSGIRAVRRLDERPMIARMSIEIALNKIPDASKLLQLDAATARIPVEDPNSFLREVNILLQLKEKRLNKKYRLPTLHGLVHYSNKPDCILGMLIDHIGNGDTLANWIDGRNPARALGEKWDNQIKDIVRVLHRCRIVWGDVKPANVIIDENRNSWVIDFGGGYNSGYVDRDVMETLEGDLQGVLRMSAELLDGKKPMPAVHSVSPTRS